MALPRRGGKTNNAIKLTIRTQLFEIKIKLWINMPDDLCRSLGDFLFVWIRWLPAENTASLSSPKLDQLCLPLAWQPHIIAINVCGGHIVSNTGYTKDPYVVD